MFLERVRFRRNKGTPPFHLASLELNKSSLRFRKNKYGDFYFAYLFLILPEFSRHVYFFSIDHFNLRLQEEVK